MKHPIVTFVVPCYRLAHYLAECVSSILSQSYTDVEIIVLDDQSPDNTPEVAQALIAAHPDRHITYVRNEVNLGNIRNYNKGIKLARGRYVWILSPDDRLRSREIMARYVQVAEADAEVGFCFCAAHTIEGERDLGPHPGSMYRATDQILDGEQLAKDIVHNNFELVAASVMIRKECYERVTLFPTDMPHRGDSYVWALISMKYKVAYFSEPMVDYRVHASSMMSTLARENVARIVEDDIGVPWRVKSEAEALGLAGLVDDCWNEILESYRTALMGTTYRGNTFSLPLEGLHASLARWAPDASVQARVRTRVAGRLYWNAVAEFLRGHLQEARKALRYALSLNPTLRYYPPLAQLMRTPGLPRRVGSVVAGAVGNLLDRRRRGP